MTGDWTSLLTQLPPGVLTGLSSRILTRIPRIQFGHILTQDELDKLSQAASLPASQSHILVDGLTDFFRSAAFASKRPAQLTKELKAISSEIPDEQLEVLTEVWSKEGANLIRALKSQSASLTGGVWVDDVSWEMGVSIASSSSSSSSPATPSCKAVLSLDLRDFSSPNSSPAASGTTSLSGERNQVSLEFDHKQLYEFYLTLETIQERMDALGKWSFSDALSQISRGNVSRGKTEISVCPWLLEQDSTMPLLFSNLAEILVYWCTTKIIPRDQFYNALFIEYFRCVASHDIRWFFW